MELEPRLTYIEQAPTRSQVLRHRLRELVLTLGAIVGVVCLLAAALAVVFDVRPVIFRSGSMSPAIETGALALSREVPASELRVGDVVTVQTPEGVNVTHRITDVALRGDKASLVLKGDANRVADDRVYVVESASRVVVDVPRLGYVVTWLTGPVGIFGAGLLVGVVLLVAAKPGPDRPRGPRRTLGALAVVGLCGAAVLPPAATSTQAYYSDVASLASGTFTAGTWSAPVPATPDITNCTTPNGNNPWTLTWTWGPGNPTEFRLKYSHTATVTTFAGTARSGQSISFHNVTGTFRLYAVVGGVESLAATANHTGGDNSKVCSNFN